VLGRSGKGKEGCSIIDENLDGLSVTQNLSQKWCTRMANDFAKNKAYRRGIGPNRKMVWVVYWVNEKTWP
jgi:hypothetical protein